MVRLEYATALLLPACAQLSIEGLAGVASSRRTYAFLILAVPLQLACVFTDWLIHGPPIEKVNVLGHTYFGGAPTVWIVVLVPYVAFGIVTLHRKISDLPPPLGRMRSHLRLAMATFVVLGVHDILIGTNLFASIHVFEYGFIVAAAVVTVFERRRERLLREERDRYSTNNAELRHKLQSVDRLASLGLVAAGTAHEINNPLSYVLANAEMLEEELAGDMSTRQLASEIVSGSQRIRRVVQELSQLSRARTANEATAVDVHKVLRGCLAMVAPQMRHRGRVVEELEPVPPVLAIETRLFQVFLNLMVNAAQAIPDGHAHANELRVRTRLVDRMVVIEIEDTGVGMTPEVQARIFEPFFTTKEPGKGTGLGLSITRDIVDEADGSISCHSEVGRGTCFRLSFPATEPAGEPLPVTTPVTHGQRRSVLIVDDEQTIATGMARILAEHEVDIACSGRDALTRIAAKQYDVILCDVMMPEVSGIQMYDVLVQNNDPAREKVVFMTGGVLSAQTEAFLQTARWIPKPVRSSDLRRIVSELT